MKSAIVFGMIGLGFALLIASGVWIKIFPPTLRWTPEKGKRMSEVKARLSDISFVINSPTRIHSGTDPASLKVESIELQKEFDQLKADFESATETPQTLSRILKWSGIAISVLGIVAWYAVKQTS